MSVVLGDVGVTATVPATGARSVPPVKVAWTRWSVGVSVAFVVVSVARYCRKRAFGLAIAPPAPTGAQADHVPSGSAVPPDRVSNVAFVPVGFWTSAETACQTLAPGPLSSGRETNVPLAAYPPMRIHSTRRLAPNRR